MGIYIERYGLSPRLVLTLHYIPGQRKQHIEQNLQCWSDHISLIVRAAFRPLIARMKHLSHPLTQLKSGLNEPWTGYRTVLKSLTGTFLNKTPQLRTEQTPTPQLYLIALYRQFHHTVDCMHAPQPLLNSAVARLLRAQDASSATQKNVWLYECKKL